MELEHEAVARDVAGGTHALLEDVFGLLPDGGAAVQAAHPEGGRELRESEATAVSLSERSS